MDDDRLARAREGDLDAFLDLVRPRAGRLLRLAAIGAGDAASARRAALAAGRTVWRDIRRVDTADQLDAGLERALVVALPRRHGGATGEVATADGPLARALRALPPAERVALARCLDPQPDPVALAVAGRAGVEVDAVARGGADDATIEIVDLGGPLAGWDLARLRAALGAAGRASTPGGPDELEEALRDTLAATRPAAAPLAALRAILPGPAAVGRGMALAVAAAVGIGVLLEVAPGRQDPGSADSAGGAATAAPRDGAGPTGSPGDGGRATDGAAALEAAAAFPDEVEGLRVIDVSQAKRLARDPALAGRTLAIRGWLSPPQLRDPCRVPAAVHAAVGDTPSAGVAAAAAPVTDPLTAAAAFCHRDAVLRESPSREWSVAHVHPQLLPGTGLGRARRVLARGDPVPVVVLAHFGDPRAGSCAAGGRHCGEGLVVDSIAWVLGASARPPVAIATPAPADDRYEAGRLAMRRVEDAYAGIVAVAASGVPAEHLGLVEPAADGVPAASGYAWLVRAVVAPQPSDALGARRTWLVVDDGSGEIVAAPGALARAGDGTAGSPGTAGFLFPRTVDGSPVRTVAEARGIVQAGLPEGTTLAVAGWLATPALAGACLPEATAVDRPLAADAAFCRRATTLRGPSPDGRGLALQLPPGTPALPIDAAIDERQMPIPVVALVESGSPRSEPCWPTATGCGRHLVLERLLWVNGRPTDVAVAQLDRAGLGAPRLDAAEVRALAETAIGPRSRIVSIVRVPADRRGDVAPGAERRPLAGQHAWIVRVRTPLGGGAPARVEQLGWVLLDDATGRAHAAGVRIVAGELDEPPPATPPG